jgi:hypothetical protein
MVEILEFWKKVSPGVFDDSIAKQKEYVSPEPHFQRVWHHYRQFLFKERVSQAIRRGDLTDEEVSRAKPFFDQNGLPSPSLYSNALSGKLGDMSSDPSFQAFQKVLEWTGLKNINFRTNTSAPVDVQFWNQFDTIYEVKESDLMEHLPLFV